MEVLLFRETASAGSLHHATPATPVPSHSDRNGLPVVLSAGQRTLIQPPVARFGSGRGCQAAAAQAYTRWTLDRV